MWRVTAEGRHWLFHLNSKIKPWVVGEKSFNIYFRVVCHRSSPSNCCVSKFMVSSIIIVATDICVWIHIFTQVNNTSPFRFAHMHMFAGLTTWDRISYVGHHSWRRLIFTWGGVMWDVSCPYWQVNYAGLVWATVLLRIHVCSFSVVCPVPGSYNLSAPLQDLPWAAGTGVVWETFRVWSLRMVSLCERQHWSWFQPVP